VSRIIRLLHCDQSYAKISLRFRLENGDAGFDLPCPTLEWQLSLPPCVVYLYDAENDRAEPCCEGELPRVARQLRDIVFSFDSKRLDSPGNRLLTTNFRGITPHKVVLSRTGTGVAITALFATELAAGEAKSFCIDLGYHSLQFRNLSHTVFLVARPDKENEAWQGALAAAMPWVDRREVRRQAALSIAGFRRFAPFLWFDRNKPLPDQVLRFLRDMPSLQRIVVFGEVLRHDLENLLTALLDRGAAQSLRLQIFTPDEYYRDQVNVLRGNIQARMIIADEPPDRVRWLAEIVSVTVVQDPNLLPLASRRFMEEMRTGGLFQNAPVHRCAASGWHSGCRGSRTAIRGGRDHCARS
jgi:hypothetical protein